MRTLVLVAAPLVCFAMACGGASEGVKGKAAVTPSATEPAPSAAAVAQPSMPPAEPPAAAAVAAVDADALKLPVEPPLAPEVNAGVIRRAALNEVLARGPGQFLQSVRMEAQTANGRFVGWRILSLFADRPSVQVAVLRPGDTVRRANGQSLEHPETFRAIWDSLSKARELVLDIDRDGRVSKLRYTIAD